MIFGVVSVVTNSLEEQFVCVRLKKGGNVLKRCLMGSRGLVVSRACDPKVAGLIPAPGL